MTSSPANVTLSFLVTVTLSAENGAEALLSPPPSPLGDGIADIVRSAITELVDNESVICENLDDGDGRISLDYVSVMEVEMRE